MASHHEESFKSLWLYYHPAIDLHQEYKFHPVRRYRLDFAHPDSKIGVDIQGGIWMKRSGHSGGSGVKKDCEKMCVAAAAGWRVFLLTGDMVNEDYLQLIANTIIES